jgi:hypothetical protein
VPVPDPYVEGIVPRAWRDAKAHCVSFVGYAAGGVALVTFGALGNVLADGLDGWKVGAVTVLAGLFGLLFVVMTAFVASIVVAPFRQRNEARSALAEFTAGDFECYATTERVGWVGEFVPGEGVPYQHAAVFWVYVKNLGRTSRFSARVTHVSGVPSEWHEPEPYAVDEPTWDGKKTSSIEIEKGSRKRLKFASALARPRAFWFWTSELQDERPGRQFHLGEDGTASITFVLAVVNSGDKDQTREFDGRIELPADLGESRIELTPVER